jgi:ubiquinone/menaquinone biosynthesis C-methylase UbiE
VKGTQQYEQEEKEIHGMSTTPDPQKKEQPDTSLVQNLQNDEELIHIGLQDRLNTISMGGPLPEQPDPTLFRHVLDIGCGTGGWAIEVARMYPAMSLVGIDIDRRKINYAREYVKDHHLADQVEFKIMDALLMLEFPNNYFDLVNLRFSSNFLRTWDWPKMLNEILKVTRTGGIVQITEKDIVHKSNSQVLMESNNMKLCAFYRAGYLFAQETTGLTGHLARLLELHGFQNVQTRPHTLEFRAGTPEGQVFCENSAYAMRTIVPFFQKWGCAGDDIDALREKALEDMQQSDFYIAWNLLSAWGTKPSSRVRRPQQLH